MHILLTGGGTGGHIIPLLAVAHELKKQRSDSTLSYAGERGSKFAHLTDDSQLFANRYFVSAGKFRRYHGQSWFARIFDVKTNILNIRDTFLVIAGLFQALRILKKDRPDMIFIKGGFVGVPIGLAAALLKIPFITHDSDTVPGLANKIIARWAILHATGMPAEFYNYPKDRTVYTGIPVPSAFQPASAKDTQAAKHALGLPKASKLLVVTGGSQGSVRINESFRAIAHSLLEAYPDLHIVHHVGRGNEEVYNSFAHQRLHIEPFIDAFAEVLRAADIVVTRGGANSLAEIGVLGKPAIVIPSPFLAGGHQLANAKHLSAKKAIIELDEAMLQKNPEPLKQSIGALLSDKNAAQTLSNNLQAMTKTNAATEIADLLLKNCDGYETSKR